MKTISQIITLLPLISFAAAAGKGYITTFTSPDCAEAAGAGPGVQGNDTIIPQDTCAEIPLFTSFLGGVKLVCANSKTPKVTAFTEQNCKGTAVDAGNLPSDGTDGPCTEILVTTGSSSLSVGGHSASFKCV